MARKLLVEGLDWGISDGALRAAFSPFGRVVEAKIATDWETGRSRGFGHVTYDDDTSARLAIETMDGTQFAGKTLRVMEAPDSGARSLYRGGDFGYVDGPTTDSEYRGGDYSDSRSSNGGRRIYRSADFGYVDEPTGGSDYRGGDYTDGRKPPATREAPAEDAGAAEADAKPSAEGEAAPAPSEAEQEEGKGPQRGGRGSKKGWHKGGSNEGVGGGSDKPFG